MEKLEAKIGYSFKNKKFLETALTHSSYANEKHNNTTMSYERQEFLGDSVLGFVTAQFLYDHEPMLPEGRMTRLRAELVCEASLHKTALNLGLGQYMRLGKGEDNTGGRTRPSILADMVEARKFVLEKVLGDVEISEQRRSADYKTQLQELVQRKANQHIAYELVSESGPDHNKVFEFEVKINGQPSGRGSGRTKKEAEQMAACKALEAMAE